MSGISYSDRPDTFSENSTDAFGRLRVSQTESLFDSVFNIDKEPEVWSESVLTGGTATFNNNTRSIDLQTTTSNGSSVIFQTKRTFKYFPGKSQLVLITGNFGGVKTNCRRRKGQFNDEDGFYFELNGSVLGVCIRSSVSGSVVNNLIEQSSWNLDKLDGSGDSGLTLDISKQQIFLIDYQWLGSGRVRFGFVINGHIVYCHEFLHANILDVPYCRTATLPIRAEITNTGATASNTTLRFTCCTVMSEGGKSPEGFVRYTSNGTTAKSVSGTGTLVPVLSIRKGSSFLNTPVKLLEGSVFLNTADDAEFVLIKNGTLTGASFSALDGVCERDVAATAITGGTVITGGYIRTTNSTGIPIPLNQLNLEDTLFLGATLAGVSDIFTIAVRNITSTSTAFANLTYKELE